MPPEPEGLELIFECHDQEFVVERVGDQVGIGTYGERYWLSIPEALELSARLSTVLFPHQPGSRKP